MSTAVFNQREKEMAAHGVMSRQDEEEPLRAQRRIRFGRYFIGCHTVVCQAFFNLDLNDKKMGDSLPRLSRPVAR